MEELLVRKFNELKDFNEYVFKKYHSDPKRWQVVVGKQTDEDEKEHRAMTLLLLDEEKYDC